MAEEEIIVTLGEMSGGDNGNRRELVKNLTNPRQKPIRKVLEQMLNPGEDNLNPAYNTEENRLKDRISGWKDQAQNSPEQYKFDIMYLKPNGQLSEPLNLDSVTGQYNDIVRAKTRRGEFGDEVKYDGIDLVARSEPIGGYK